YRVLWPDSSVHWVASQGRALRNSAGQVVRLVGTAMDVTERKQAERGRQVLVQMERLRALGQMASGVAHDLNQSLALMAGYSDLIRQALAEPTIDRAQVLEMIDIIARAAADGGQTVSRLLTFVRTTPQDQAERVDLGELLREVAQLTAPRWRDAAQAEGRPIELTVASEGDTSITGRPSSLREAITNLIFNAVDALPTGGTIHLAAWRQVDRAACWQRVDRIEDKVRDRLTQARRPPRDTGVPLARHRQLDRPPLGLGGVAPAGRRELCHLAQ